MMPKDRIRQISVVLLSVTQLVTNSLGGAGINGRSIGSVSDSFTTAFTPAGVTFAVWGPIYIGLTAYAIYQALPGQASRTIHRRVGWLAVLAAAANSAWTPLFVTENITLSLVVMLGLLASLASIFVVLRRLRGSLTTADRWAVMIPYSGYFAWITVATIANVITTLLAWGWGGWGVPPELWSVGLLAVATGITSGLIVYSQGHAGIPAYTGVLVWAFIGVYLAHAEQYGLVGAAALAAAVVVAGVTAWRFWQSPERQQPSQQAATA